MSEPSRRNMLGPSGWPQWLGPNYHSFFLFVRHTHPYSPADGISFVKPANTLGNIKRQFKINYV